MSIEANAEKIIVADGANHRVQVFDSDGKFEYARGEEGNGVGQLQRPRDVCWTPEKDIVVADTKNDRIQIFKRDWSVVVLGQGPGSEPGQLRKPSGVAVCEDGRLVVADTGNNRIQIFNMDGTVEKVSMWAAGQDEEPAPPWPAGMQPLLAFTPHSRCVYHTEHRAMCLRILRGPSVHFAVLRWSGGENSKYTGPGLERCASQVR